MKRTITLRIDAETHKSFKETCQKQGVKMGYIIEEFMSDYINMGMNSLKR